MKLTFLVTASTLLAAAFASPGTPTVNAPSKTDEDVKIKARCGTPFKYFGVNEAGAEANSASMPGILGVDYAWPSASSVDYFVGAGFNTFRLPFLMERLSSAGARQPFNPTYLSTLKQAVAYISGKGAYTILDPHNYMRFNGSLITSTADFQAWWTQFAREFAYEPRVIFAAMNKPNGLEINLVASLNQAALDGIRAAGATSQLVLLEGSDSSYARSWISSGNAVTMNRITDPSNNFAFSMHLYLDRDGSGKSPDCVSESIGAERLSATTEWLKLYKYRAIISEIGAGSNPLCIAAIVNSLCHMQQASSAWLGALWWSAGAFQRDHFMSIEPPNGPALRQILPEALIPFL